MEALQKQVSLLKSYVSTLEHENEARNNEKNTLFAEIDRLTQQNDRLNDLLSKSKFKMGETAPSSQLQAIRKQNSSLTVQVNTLKASIATLTAQNISLKAKGNSDNSAQLSLEIQNQRKKISQLSSENSAKDYEIRNLNQSKDDLLQQLNRVKIQLSEQSRSQAQIERLRNEIGKLEKENRELRQAPKSSSQVSNLLNTKLNLEASIRQLTSKVQWVEATNKSLQRENKDYQSRVTQLEKQLYEAKGRLTQLRFNEDSYKSIEASLKIKDKEMEALEHMIATLKDNKKYLQQALKEKEGIIVNLESQVYTFRSSAHDFSDLERQLNQLKAYKNSYEHSIKDLSRNNQQLSLQIVSLKRQITTLSSELNQAKQEKEKLLREQTSYLQQHRLNQEVSKSKVRDSSEVIMYRSISPPREMARAPGMDQDLRVMVEQLRSQVQQLKKVPLSQSQLYPVYNEPRRNVGVANQWSGVVVKEKSLMRESMKKSHSRVIVEKERQSNNRQKWQNLQKKINALRSQNESLKKSLFD